MSDHTPRAAALILASAALAAAASFGAAANADDADDAADDVAPGALREAPRALDAREHWVGELVPDVAFEDIDGKAGSLAALTGKPVVVVVRSVGCPVGKRFAPEIARIIDEYTPRGVSFILVNPMEQDDVGSMRAEIERHGFGRARYVPDAEKRFVDALDVQTTTEAFVIDAGRTLAFRGAIDDQYGIGFAKDEASNLYLRPAIESVLAGTRPTIEAVWAPGCRIEGRKPRADAPASAPTWHGRVSRIVNRNCMECHRPGMSGPFPLTSYAEVKGNKDMISFMVENQAMPPWFADADHSRAFRNDRSLSERDRADLLAWIEAGCPEGDVTEAAAEPSWAPGWSIGEPDAVVQLPRMVHVKAEGTIPYKNLEVTTSFDEDKWVTALEVQSSATEQIHHILVFIRYPRNHPRSREQPRSRGGLKGYFAAMVPGQADQVLPDGMAKFLPKGAQLRFQLHYTANGTAVEDRPRIGFKFAKEPPRHQMKTGAVSNTMFRIPAGDPNYKVGYSKTFSKPTRILGVLPHMHLRGKAFKYTLIWPDGRREVIVDIPRYDFNWQLLYRFAEPIDVPAGTTLRADGWYDNSAGNPANPDPTRPVRFGEQTWEEMMIGYYDYIELDRAPAAPSKPAPPARPRADRKVY